MKLKLLLFSFLIIFVSSLAIKAESGSYQSCIEEAEESRNMGETDEAIKHYTESMKYRNEDTAALFAIGQLYEEQGNIYQAQEYYDKVLARSTDPRKIYDIGAFYARQNQLNKVEDIYLKAWRHRGNIFETNMGMGDYSLMVKDYEKAIDFYEFAIRKKENQDSNITANLYFRYAVCLNCIGKKEDALIACKTALRYNNNEEIREFYRKLGGQ